MEFLDRSDAGVRLADELKEYANQKDTIVIALPRGGVPVAYEVARGLHLPLDIVVPRKIGCPGHSEYAVGAVSEEGEVWLDQEALGRQRMGPGDPRIVRIIEGEKGEARRRLLCYRQQRPPLDLTNKHTIVVDDGIATGATLRAAVSSCVAKGATDIVCAVPVAPHHTLQLLATELGGVVRRFHCLYRDPHFMAVGQYYHKFPQTGDDEVIGLLARNQAEHAQTRGQAHTGEQEPGRT